ncbi:MAG: TIGR04255 family protein [Gammaproteobacteria bacterium]
MTLREKHAAGPRTGQLSHAPLVYVLAQVRFTSITNMVKYVPEIQDRFRKDYPRYQAVKTHEMKIPLGPGDQSAEMVVLSRWEFADKDNRSGFILLDDALMYHTTAYETFEPFLEKFQRGIDIIHEMLKLDLTTRVGLRYVDLIVPEPQEKLSQYVVPGLTGFPFEEITGGSGKQQAAGVVKTSEGQLVVRFTQDDASALIPQDLADHSLTPARTVEKGQPRGILDTDHFATPDRADFTVEDVVGRISRLHEISSIAFKKIISDYAWEKWG